MAEEEQMNLGFWDAMSRYRKARRKMEGHELVERETVPKKLRVPRIVLIAIGVTVTLAVALVLLSQATSSQSREVVTKSTTKPWHVMKRHWRPTTLSRTELIRMNDKFDLDRLWRTMQPILVARVPGTPALRQVTQHIVKTLKNLDFLVQLDQFKDFVPPDQTRTEFTNIVATWNKRAKRRLVLACHYDSKVTPKGFIGATDSACPCAMIIEIATILQPFLRDQREKQQTRGIPHDLTLQLIFFDGEEAFVQWTKDDSLYGSRHLAKLWHGRKIGNGLTELDKMDLMILLDLIGTPETTFRNFTATPTMWYDHAARMEHEMHRHGLLRSTRWRFPTAPFRGHVEDDHIPFQQRGVPILHLISVPFPTQWHTLADDESILDNVTISDVTKVVAATTAQYLHLSITE